MSSLITPASVSITSNTRTRPTHFPQVRVQSIVEQSQWEFVTPKEDGVGIVLFCRKARSEVIQSGLRDNPGVTYPSISPTANENTAKLHDAPNHLLSGWTLPGVVSSSPF